MELIVALALYFAPTLVATGRKHHNHRAIFALNLLTGWTVVGWIAALVWALTATNADKYTPPASERLGAAANKALALNGPKYTPEERAALREEEEKRWADTPSDLRSALKVRSAR